MNTNTTIGITPMLQNIHGKQALTTDSRILNPDSGFKEKLSCEAPTFTEPVEYYAITDEQPHPPYFYVQFQQRVGPTLKLPFDALGRKSHLWGCRCLEYQSAEEAVNGVFARLARYAKASTSGLYKVRAPKNNHHMIASHVIFVSSSGYSMRKKGKRISVEVTPAVLTQAECMEIWRLSPARKEARALGAGKDDDEKRIVAIADEIDRIGEAGITAQLL